VRRCNLGTVELASLREESELWLLYALIEDHVRATGSPIGNRILDNWEMMVGHFVKVLPLDYKRVLAERRAARRPQTRPRLAIAPGTGT
jgi:glutamate synthase (NADPH) large chain